MTRIIRTRITGTPDQINQIMYGNRCVNTFGYQTPMRPMMQPCNPYYDMGYDRGYGRCNSHHGHHDRYQTPFQKTTSDMATIFAAGTGILAGAGILTGVAGGITNAIKGKKSSRISPDYSGITTSQKFTEKNESAKRGEAIILGEESSSRSRGGNSALGDALTGSSNALFKGSLQSGATSLFSLFASNLG